MCKASYSREGIKTWGYGGGQFLRLMAYLSFFSFSTPKFMGGSTDFIRESANYGSF